ncbi:MAG: hypothetical protein QOI86_255, partial [Actinomycetota bacterium]|nr:hypothetical protein [Actinomycetota bacterium]
STLKRPARRPAGTGPLRSLLPAPPDTVQTPERPSQPVRSLVADPVPVSTDQVPADAVPSPTPVPDSAPPVPETFQPAKDRLQELPTAVGPAPDQRPPRPGILPLR